MKKLCIFLILIALLVVSTGFSPSEQDTDTDHITSAETVNNNSTGIGLTEEDADKIIDYYSNWNETRKKSEHSNLHINQGYYLYSRPVYSNDLVDEVKQGTNIKDLISENFRMVVPTDGGYIEFVKDGSGKVSWLGSSFSGSQKHPGLVDISVVDNILSSEEYSEATGVIAFSDSMYMTSFVYFNLNDVEYLIPFSSRPDFTGLENGKVYKASDCISILSKNMPRDNIDPNANGGYGEIYPELKDNDIVPIVVGATVGSCVLLAAVVIYTVGRRKKLELRLIEETEEPEE